MQKEQIRDFVKYVETKKQRCLNYQGYCFYLEEWRKNENKQWVCVKSECQCRIETSEDNVLINFKGEHSHSNRLVEPPLNSPPTTMRAFMEYMKTKSLRELPMDVQKRNRKRLTDEVYQKCKTMRKTCLRTIVLQMHQLYSIFDSTRLKFRLRITFLKMWILFNMLQQKFIINKDYYEYCQCLL